MERVLPACTARLWFEGTGRLPEVPDIALIASQDHQKGLDSFFDLPFECLGYPLSETADIMERVIKNARYRMCSAKYYLSSVKGVKEVFTGDRYQKGETSLCKTANGDAILWDPNPFHLLEVLRGLSRGDLNGWEEDPVIFEGRVSSTMTIPPRNIYLLREKHVVAANKAFFACMAAVAGVSLSIGVIIGSLLH